MPVLPGAEPYRHEGGEVGVLLCHGFTGSPQSLRPWARYLAGQGLTVSLPLLPGHGTHWTDMAPTGWQDWYAEVDRELRTLRDRCARVFVAGLSMGGALALRLAAKHGEGVEGVIVVNPANKVHGLSAYALPVARHLVRTTKGITSDIARAGVLESGYDRVPLHSAHSCGPSSGLSTASCRRSPSRCCFCTASRTMSCRRPTRPGSSAGCPRRT